MSDFDGIEDLLLALNEITTIGQDNARLTAQATSRSSLNDS